MPYEPLVLLHRLAPEDVNQLIRPNRTLPPVVSQQPQNVQRFQNDGETASAQSSQKNVLVVRGGVSRVESQQQTAAGSSLTVQVSTANPDDMVNNTALPKLRNSTSSAIGVNSNNNSTSVRSATSSRDPTVAKDRITDETNLIMTSKSSLSAITPVIEVVDKKTKEILISNHLTSDEHNSSGLSLRTRTISSTTAPAPFHQSSISQANSVQLNNCSTSTINGRRPRGRRPRQKSFHLAGDDKPSQHASINKSVESKVCNSNSNVPKEEPGTSGLERLQQKQSLNYCNGTTKYNEKQDNSFKTSSDNVAKKRLTLLPNIEKNKESIVGLFCNKKSNYRKRKHCSNEDSVAEKRFLASGSVDDSLEVQKNPNVATSLPNKDQVEISFGFLQDRADKYNAAGRNLNCSLYGQTYWPINWGYSAAGLTSHVHKKVTKDELRKIRQINSDEATNKTLNWVSLKSNLNLKKSQTSLSQRRRIGNRWAPSTSVEIPSCSKQQHTPTTSNVVKRKKLGRPPGKNKLLQRVMKLNSPRKSPRQHASTLAAIRSNKDPDNGIKLELSLSDKTIDVDTESSDKKFLDMDRPCVLPVAVPKNELKLSERHNRHRRQLDHPHSVLLDRRHKRRSVTPPPPKLCAQQPVSQRSCINSSSVDQEVKLRTKHVDVVRRRARDERLRSIFVCQQLKKLSKISSEQVQQGYDIDYDECSARPLPPVNNDDQFQVWSSTTADVHQELNNMCLQIMFEQTNDIRYLRNRLTDETLETYTQQRELASIECMNNNYGETVTSDLGADMMMVGGNNRRKKKRPNMTGWPKEKRRKTIAAANLSVADDETPQNYDRILERRRKAAEKQRLRRQRIKLEQQQLAKEKSKITTANLPKRPGRRSSTKKNIRTVKFARRTTSVSSNYTVDSSDTNSLVFKTERRGRKKKNAFLERRQNRKSVRDKEKITLSVPKATVASKKGVKRKLGRPKGSMGHKNKMKLDKLQRAQNQTSLPSDQQKENVQVSSGKLKCVISTRNNRMKLLSSQKAYASSNKKKANGTKIKKSAGGVCNTSSSMVVLSPSRVTSVVGKSARITARKRRLQLLQQMPTSTTWDVGRPKRYQSANHSRVAIEEDYCFVGSQPFEQHCPNGEVGLNQKTIIDNQETHQKENLILSAL